MVDLVKGITANDIAVETNRRSRKPDPTAVLPQLALPQTKSAGSFLTPQDNTLKRHSFVEEPLPPVATKTDSYASRKFETLDTQKRNVEKAPFFAPQAAKPAGDTLLSKLRSATEELSEPDAVDDLIPPQPEVLRPVEKKKYSVDDLYYQFFNLMARLIQVDESQANEIYRKVKERTDGVELLTTLIGKINNANGPIDWSKDEANKKLVDQARALGTEIPAGKYKWTHDEAKLLQENLRQRKDSIDKMIQLERTEMQRFMQQISQHHQTRSNLLKMMERVATTIIENIRR